MRYLIRGADRETGEDRQLELDAETERDALMAANVRGLVVESIGPATIAYATPAFAARSSSFLSTWFLIFAGFCVFALLAVWIYASSTARMNKPRMVAPPAPSLASTPTPGPDPRAAALMLQAEREDYVAAANRRIGPPFRLGDQGMLPDGFRVFQIIGEKVMLVQRGNETYMVIGPSTYGLVDDAAWQPVGPYRVRSTETYRTPLGVTRTVFVLTPVPIPGA